MSVCSGAQFFVGYCVVFVLRVGRLVHMQHVFSFRRSVVLAECLGTHVGTMVGIMKTVFVVLCERFCGFFCLVCVSLLVVQVLVQLSCESGHPQVHRFFHETS